MKIVLRVLIAAALVGIAVVHLRIAHTYSDLGKHPLSLGDQFYVQAGLAIALAVGVLVRPVLLVWVASALLAAGSLAVLVYSRYRALPVYGLPGGFQESWGVQGAKPAAVFESAALLLSLVGVVTTRPHRAAAPRTPAVTVSAG